MPVDPSFSESFKSPVKFSAKRNIPWLVALLSLCPSLVWIFADRRVWPFDQAWYGEVTVELFYTLLRQPSEWPHAMVVAIGQKPPLLSWIGQFFVPVGILLGSIDASLLLSVLLTQFLTLVLVLKVVRRSCEVFSTGVCVAGILVVASAPLFVALSHQYLTESIQTLSVAWFILIAAKATRSNRNATLAQLIAASSVGMLAKISTPLYVVGPVLFALIYVFGVSGEPVISRRSIQFRIGTWFPPLVLLFAAVLWYANNWKMAWTHFRYNAGEGALLYGTPDTFQNLLMYRILSTQQGFGFPIFFWSLTLLVAAGLLLWLRRLVTAASVSWTASSSIARSGALLACLSALQIFIVVIAFSFNYTREDRYLLPILPYCAVLTSWALAQLNHRFLTGSVIACLVLQWGLVYAQALNLLPVSPSVTGWLKPMNSNASESESLQSIINYTCDEESEAWRYNIIGVELPSLNSNSAAYYVAKARHERPFRCYYTSLGYAESDSNRAWQRMFDLKTLYFIAPNPQIRKIPDDPFNKTSVQILDRIEKGNEFIKVPFAADTSILVFRSK
jgi:hypothetical protein